MQVIATAGHVDHGKSTLVRALTGMEPDRWAEERRRGMTIDLGYAWTTLPSGEVIAFVDVPGHERFITNMLAGVGPVPAVLLVIAADEGWCAQTDEHVRALDALGVRHGVMAVTRCDLADASAAIEQAHELLATTTLAGIPAVSVSGQTGAGIGALRAALDDAGGRAATRRSRFDARIRLWVDRSFTVRGSGTVVTGTLAAGTLRRGDVLELRRLHGRRRGGPPATRATGGPCDRACSRCREPARRRARRRPPWRRAADPRARGAAHDRGGCPRRRTARGRSHVVVHVGAAAVPAKLLDARSAPPPWPGPLEAVALVRLTLDARAAAPGG